MLALSNNYNNNYPIQNPVTIKSSVPCKETQNNENFDPNLNHRNEESIQPNPPAKKILVQRPAFQFPVNAQVQNLEPLNVKGYDKELDDFNSDVCFKRDEIMKIETFEIRARAINNFCNQGKFSHVMVIFRTLEAVNYEKTVRLGNALIKNLCKFGKIQEADSVCQIMNEVFCSVPSRKWTCTGTTS